MNPRAHIFAKEANDIVIKAYLSKCAVILCNFTCELEFVYVEELSGLCIL